MAITFVGAEADDVTTEDITINVPAGVQDGDVLLAFYHNPDDDPLSVTLSGFTQIALIGDATGNDTKSGVWYRIASGEPASYLFDSTGSASIQTAAAIVAFRGVDTGNPFDVTFVQGSHYVKRLDDTTPAPQPITTATNGAWAVVYSGTTISVNVTDITGPALYTQRAKVIGSNRDLLVATREIATAGVETPGDITLVTAAGTEDTALITLALKPATGISAAILRRRQC